MSGPDNVIIHRDVSAENPCNGMETGKLELELCTVLVVVKRREGDLRSVQAKEYVFGRIQREREVRGGIFT